MRNVNRYPSGASDTSEARAIAIYVVVLFLLICAFIGAVSLAIIAGKMAAPSAAAEPVAYELHVSEV